MEDECGSFVMETFVPIPESKCCGQKVNLGAG